MVNNNCIYCEENTAFGYGKFVNRLAQDDGYACAECAGYNCDRCNQQIYLDEDITASECGGGEEFTDGAVHVCRGCLTMNEWEAFNNLEVYHSDKIGE